MMPAMIVYRTSTRQVDPSLELSRCLTMAADDAEAMTSRLLGIGGVEVALSDLWMPLHDSRDPRALTLANATRWAARTLVEADGPGQATATSAERHLRHALSQCLRMPLPPGVELRAPQGFAYDALHPLAYAAATADCLKRWHPSRVAVVGLRTIGATLGAVVAAHCDHNGVPTWTCTLRPRGASVARECRIDAALALELQAQAGSLCLIVDEGPGLSGSSLLSAATVLEAHGHRREHIVFLCSHEPQPGALRARAAAQRWGMYTRVIAPSRGPSFAEDWSAGAWRAHIGLDVSRWPPVHPQHERNKGVPADAPGELHKFVGYGTWGVTVGRRASRAADAGFGVPVFGVRDGYMRMARVSPASTMSRRGTWALAATVLKYLPWRAWAMQTGDRADTDALLGLLATNAREHFGGAHDTTLLQLERLARASAPRPAVVIDGHLSPWEWLTTPTGVVKVDTAEHGDDHFQPGPQDIAWDVAAVLGEFAWTSSERASLVERLAVALKDPSLAHRLRWMRPCYLAARMGYSAVAAESLGDTADGRGFGRQARRYARQLAGALGH
ncbi:hypothetical protein LuPra_01227 [Luteitalea pratensis]|uniref:Uncharacterized protein n=1 Tax=Luteitalea pratensis TaxID=1855912 RepID=A0A143PJU4_LUTPR|nr:hypothetical protein [Luteitalea pratensis]AMY08039.1 hypothetical protein LuPra_01227 [Luteitalea pratensis]